MFLSWLLNYSYDVEEFLYKATFADANGNIRKLSRAAIACWLRLLKFQGGRDSCFPAVETIANRMKCSVRQVQRYLADLECAGLLKREFRKRRTSVYHFVTGKIIEPLIWKLKERKRKSGRGWVTSSTSRVSNTSKYSDVDTACTNPASPHSVQPVKAMASVPPARPISLVRLQKRINDYWQGTKRAGDWFIRTIEDQFPDVSEDSLLAEVERLIRDYQPRTLDYFQKAFSTSFSHIMGRNAANHKPVPSRRDPVSLDAKFYELMDSFDTTALVA